VRGVACGVRNSCLLAFLFVACSPAPLPRPSTPAVPVAAREAEPAPRDANEPRVERPYFLAEDFQPPALRVTRHRDGAVRASLGAEVINTPSERAMIMHYPVIEPDAPGESEGPRIYCDDHPVRIALYVEAASLATVALEGAVLGLDASTPPAANVPGVYFEGGARLEVIERGEPMARVRFHGFMLEAEGFVESARIGNVYVPTEHDDSTWNAELREGATFLETPRGRALSQLEPYPNTEQRHVATTLGAPRNGYTLVRFVGAGATVIGWVETRRVTVVGEQSGGRGIGRGGGGRGQMALSHPVRLPAGTRLLAAPSGEWIGILVQERELECLEGCDGDAPRVEVPTCLGTVRLWTAPAEAD
jgi:hypothetical protein